MKFQLAFAVFILSFGALRAQIDILGFSPTIQNSVKGAFPTSTFLTQAVGMIPTAVGNGGDATVDYISNGAFFGDGLTGSVTASANVNIGTGVSTSVVWNTT
jgi:hypothetical protein